VAQGLTAEHQRLKWEHYEGVRLERVEVLNEARRALAEDPYYAAAMPGVAAASGRPGGFLAADHSYSGYDVHGGGGDFHVPGGRASGMKASAIKVEENRLEAARRRAEKEVSALEFAREKQEQRHAAMEGKVRRAGEVDMERQREKVSRERARQRDNYQRAQDKKAEQERGEELQRQGGHGK